MTPVPQKGSSARAGDGKQVSTQPLSQGGGGMTKAIHARDIMVTKLITLSPDMKLLDAAKLFSQEQHLWGSRRGSERKLDRRLFREGCHERVD